MGLFNFLRRLFFSPPQQTTSAAHASRRSRGRRGPVRLVPLRRDREDRQKPENIEQETLPYRFAHYGLRRGRYLNLCEDGDEDFLAEFGLPVFHTPEQLADWLVMPLGEVAWLTHRFSESYRPENQQRAHYHFRWIRKRSGGWRLVEAPKPKLKRVQTLILREILDRIPPHDTAHGFVRKRSILTNARQHAGQRVILKLDLENFYAAVSYTRVVSIFRSLGYSREAALWLARLTTSKLPPNIAAPDNASSTLQPFSSPHLPQGAPSSPALANLSAFGLDVRLSGLARSFGAGYTRYADDLTFSGPQQFLRSLPTFIPLTSQIVREERFRVNRKKRKVIRDNQRQTVAGVVVNERPNISRRDYDRLKAILTNCVRHGPSSQNRDSHDQFAHHLRGRIAHVRQLNLQRGEKLLDLFRQIDWQQ